MAQRRHGVTMSRHSHSCSINSTDRCLYPIEPVTVIPSPPPAAVSPSSPLLISPDRFPCKEDFVKAVWRYFCTQGRGS